MRRVLLLFLAFLACTAGPIAAPVSATTGRSALAFIAEINGRVEVARPSSKNPERGTLGLPLQRGDKVQVSTGGSATLLFNDGNLVELSEKSSITVGAQAKKPGAEANLVMAGVFKSVSEGVVGGSRETGLVALAPVRGGSARAELILSPRQTEIMEARPRFLWHSVSGATRYRVSISGDAGELWQHETADTALGYPADAPPLPTGADLLWKLSAAGDRGPLEDEENSFRIKPSEESAAIRLKLEQIEKNAGGAAPFLAGAYLGGQGLLLDAIARFERLCQKNPHQPGPHEALGQLYRAVGLMDLAATELQTALDLSREP